MDFLTSSEESSLNLSRLKKRGSTLGRSLSQVKKTGKTRRPSRTASWKLRESQDDPVSAPTPSEVEVARTLLKLTKRKMNRRHSKNYLRVPKPPGMAPLFGSYREIQCNRKTSRARSAPLPQNHESQCLLKAYRSSGEHSSVSTKSHELGIIEGLTSEGASVMNAPCFVLPTSTPDVVSETLTEGPFNQDLNKLHESAGKLTELIRTGQIDPIYLEKLMTQIPPAVFEPEFHEEIEQVRSKQKQHLTIRSQLVLFTDKSLNEF